MRWFIDIIGRITVLFLTAFMIKEKGELDHTIIGWRVVIVLLIILIIYYGWIR